MGISRLQWRGWSQARGCFRFTRVSLHCLLSLSPEMARGWRGKKPKGFVLRSPVRERPLEQIQPLDHISEGQTAAT